MPNRSKCNDPRFWKRWRLSGAVAPVVRSTRIVLPNNAEFLDRLLRFDPLAEAETITGSSYKGDPDTRALGFMLLQQNGAIKQQLLEVRGDTTFNNQLDRYLEIVAKEGFREILRVPFTSRWNEQECLYVMYHDGDGILLTFDTYCGEKVNGGKFYYNIKMKPDEPNWHVISSGHYCQVGDDYVWVGDHDCREALRHHIAQLRAHGEFIKEWIEQPFLWLLHHGDTKDDNYDHKEITAERIAMFPIEVQKAIAGEK